MPLVLPIICTFFCLFIQAWRLPGAVSRRGGVPHGAKPDPPSSLAALPEEIPVLSEDLGFDSSDLISLVSSILLSIADIITDVLFITVFNTCGRLRVPSIIFVCIPASMMWVGAIITMSIGMHAPEMLNDSNIKHDLRLRLPSAYGATNTYSIQPALDLAFSCLVLFVCSADLRALSLLPWSVDNTPKEEGADGTFKELHHLLSKRGHLPDWQLCRPFLRMWMTFWSLLEDFAQISIQMAFLLTPFGENGCYPSLSEATGTTVSILFSFLRLSEQGAIWMSEYARKKRGTNGDVLS